MEEWKEKESSLNEMDHSIREILSGIFTMGEEFKFWIVESDMTEVFNVGFSKALGFFQHP